MYYFDTIFLFLPNTFFTNLCFYLLVNLSIVVVLIKVLLFLCNVCQDKRNNKKRKPFVTCKKKTENMNIKGKIGVFDASLLPNYFKLICPRLDQKLTWLCTQEITNVSNKVSSTDKVEMTLALSFPMFKQETMLLYRLSVRERSLVEM